MADRTSAALFSYLFEKLADNEPIDAKYLWELQNNYDFSPQQMECDEALEKLGLLWKCSSQICLEQGDSTWNYGPEIICQQCEAKKSL